jgi:hypothetical protein
MIYTSFGCIVCKKVITVLFVNDSTKQHRIFVMPALGWLIHRICRQEEFAVDYFNPESAIG